MALSFPFHPFHLQRTSEGEDIADCVILGDEGGSLVSFFAGSLWRKAFVKAMDMLIGWWRVRGLQNGYGRGHIPLH